MESAGQLPEKKYVDFFPLTTGHFIYVEEVHIAAQVCFESVKMRLHSVLKFKHHEVLHLVRINTLKHFV